MLVIAAFALFTASCGSSDDDSDAQDSDTPAATVGGDTSDDDMSDDDSDDMSDDMAAHPGEGTSVTMGRADWATGYFQAEVFAALLRELGYEVTNPAENQLAAATGFLAIAERNIDFWANTWSPSHVAHQQAELSDGSLISDNITTLGELMVGGSLQGYLIEKTFADEFGIKTMEDLNNNPAAIAAYDAVDPIRDNGVADIYGCQESWTCDDIITSQIAFSGWNNIAQTIAGYDAMFAEATDKAASKEPFIIYTWTPSAYITNLRPGDNVYWLATESVLDDSNPLDRDGGEKFDMRPGTVRLDVDKCPAVAENSDNLCQVGWVNADIQVTANNDFLAANPAAEALFEAVTLSVLEVSLANVAQNTDDADPADQALSWIEDNREKVDGWLSSARASA